MRSTSHDPALVLSHLGGELASRPATSREEASAAAYINGRLRDAGFGVGTDSFTAAADGGFSVQLLLVLVLAAAALIPVTPLLSMALSLIVALLWLADSLVAPLPSLARRRTTQNIVATLAVQGSGGLAPRVPRRRVVLLAPLDTAPRQSSLRTLGGYGRAALLLRLLACLGIAIGAALVWLSGAVLWSSLAVLPACYLAFLLALSLLPSRQVASGSDGALAALIQLARRLQPTRNIEVWAVALGATSTDSSAIAELLRLYPFDRNTTLFIALNSLETGRLAYAARDGALRVRECDSELIALLAEGGQNREPRTENREPSAENRAPSAENRELRFQRAESREQRAVPLAVELSVDRSLIATLLRDEYRATSLLSVAAPGGLATPALVEQCADLLDAVIKALDARSQQSEVRRQESA
jgi:hypothetical protein